MAKFKISQITTEGTKQSEAEYSYDELSHIVKKDFTVIKIEFPENHGLTQQELDSLIHNVNENEFYNSRCKDKSKKDITSYSYSYMGATLDEIVKSHFSRIFLEFFDKKSEQEEHIFDTRKKLSLFYDACKHDNLEVAKWLVSNGIDIDQLFSGNITALHLACQNNSPKIASWLIENGADLEAPDDKGMTPIFHSYQHHDLKVAKLLADAGASLNSREEFHKTQFFYVCEMGKFEAAKWLADEKNIKINHKSKFGDTPLHGACGNGHFELAKWLAEEKGFKVDAANNFGDTPLHEACKKYNNFAMCNWLINDKHANINIKNQKGATPVTNASKNNNLGLFQWLVEEKIDNFSDEYNIVDALLRHICKFGSQDAIQWLIKEKGANINSCDEKGNTPLHIAVNEQHISTITYLLRLGANCAIKNKSNVFPLQTDLAYCCDLYKKLLDYRIIEEMPWVVLDTLPEEWFEPANRLALLSQLVASTGFIAISTDTKISLELMHVHTGVQGYRYGGYGEEDLPDYVKKLEDFFEVICEANKVKVQAVSCCKMLGKEWNYNTKNREALNELGAKIINLHFKEICSSEDILSIIQKATQSWNSNKGFNNLLLKHFIDEAKFDKAISFIKYESKNAPQNASGQDLFDFSESLKALQEIKYSESVQCKDASCQDAIKYLEEITSSSLAPQFSEPKDLAGSEGINFDSAEAL